MAETVSDERLIDLAAEVRRVADCPYTPSLQRLHDVLQRIDNQRLLLRWARGNACQIDSLAAAVLEGLELWPNALDILRILAYIPAFRDAVLQQKPMLLDTLIRKAIESDSAFDKYSATCVCLLSHPVEIAIPSKFPDLLMQLVDKAVRSLSPETIRPIYQILSAMGSSYLDILSFDVIARLQDRLVEVLTKLNMDDRFGDLLCLGVLAKFASRPCNPSDLQMPNIQSSPIDRNSMAVADRYVSARKLFEDKRAPKTLDLAVIRAITACSESCALSATDIAESLKLSGEIVEAFDCREKQAWVAKNGGKVKKLHQKILRTDIAPEIQCQALNLLVTLSDGQHLPHELFPVFEKLLLTSNTTVFSARAISQYMIQLNEAVIGEILLKLLRLACDNNPPSHELLTQLDGGLHLVATITAAIPTATSLREVLLSCIAGKQIERLLQQFVTQLPTSSESVVFHNMAEVCPRACAKALYQLHQDITVMLLSTALYASGLETSLRDSSRLLLQKQKQLSNSQLRYDNSKQGGVTSPLPLREEQTKSQDLRAHLEAARGKVAELEEQAGVREQEFIGLTNERNELLDQIETHKDCLKGLEANLDNIRQEYDQAQSDADMAVQTAVENARQRDLAYLATLTGKDQIFEEQSSMLAASEIRAEVASHAETIQDQKKAIEELNSGIATAKDLAASQEAKIDGLRESERDLISSRDDIARKAQDEAQVHESAISGLKEELQAAKAEAAGLQKQYDNHAGATEAEILRLEESLRTYTKKWQSELTEARNTAALADQHQASTIADLRSKIKRLRKERQERAKEFAEAQELSARLMAVMGITKNQRAFCDTSTTGSREERSASSLCKPYSPVLPVSDLTASSESSDSNRSGPTPKRTKRPRSSQSKRDDVIPTGRASTRSVLKQSRVPLAELGSRQSQGPATPTQLLHHLHSYNQKEVDGEALRASNRHAGSDDECFGGGDIFTSTDQQRLSVLGNKPPESMFDETTAEF
ncbi:hypothetical protein JMJ35_007252 [Cladonia borealis]|uniref:Uncharacterized protein n=1 Tax=Cladonia borealis TaxID=184061 RepID=A0AA39QY45_9LECA|nr:hypothetical protein JMJ35_007252 [Cladonia borealis]